MSLLARDRLTTTLFLAGAVHALIILGVTFSSSRPSRTAPGLEVLLVNDEVPESRKNPQARYLAQRSQRGNGNTRDLPTGSPLMTPPQPTGAPSPPGAADADDNPPLLSASGPQPEISYFPDAPPASAVPQLAGAQTARSLAGRGDSPELLLRGDANSSQWLIADTEMSLIAPYLDSWRRKVERLGTLNYPNAARLIHTSSQPVIEVVLNASGRLESAKVQRSSGQAELDQAALDILRAASPFEAFPRALSAQYQSLRFAYEWDFVGGRQNGTVTVGTNGGSGP